VQTRGDDDMAAWDREIAELRAKVAELSDQLAGRRRRKASPGAATAAPGAPERSSRPKAKGADRGSIPSIRRTALELLALTRRRGGPRAGR